MSNDSCESVVGVLDQVASNFGRTQHPDHTAALAHCRWNLGVLFDLGWTPSLTSEDLARAHKQARAKRRFMAIILKEQLKKHQERVLALFTRAELREFAADVDVLDDEDTDTMLKEPLISVLSQNFDAVGMSADQIAEKKLEKSAKKAAKRKN